MDHIASFFHSFLLVIGVVLLFNLMIFVHELGHFWAARWRGLYVDRFQIWFGKPLWKKTINGVDWGLGWIPAGGFVSIPQLAPMDSIEGEVDADKVREYLKGKGMLKEDDARIALPPIKAKDKIIVAFAGPLFSFLLALLFSIVVWNVGKPGIQMNSTTVGYIAPGSPAAASGLQLGDRIIAVDGEPVKAWIGNMEGVKERIMLSEHQKVRFTVERPGSDKPIEIESGYIIPESKWWERSAMRQVGFSYSSKAVVGNTLPGSPAEKAGLKPGDVIVALNGQKVWSPMGAVEELGKGEPVKLLVSRDGKGEFEVELTPALPLNASELKPARPLSGIEWGFGDDIKEIREYPAPFEQIGNSLNWMKLTMEKIFASGSDVGVQHLSGPVGIGTQFYNMLNSPEGWSLALWFAVVLNINLAILNLLPLPVVDGGHVVLGIVESIRGRVVSGKPLEVVQTGFVIVLMLFFLFVTSKDLGDLAGRFFGREKAQPMPRFVEKQEQGS